MESEDAEQNAEYVLDIFGFEEQVIDNLLDPEDRQLFYALQEEGLLTTRSEETALWNGQEWRTHYWVLRMEKILSAAHIVRAREAEAPERDVYADLPAEVWARHPSTYR